MKINRNFDNLVPNYLFADVAKKTNAYIAVHPDKKVIKLGIGDVTLPLAPVVVEAMYEKAQKLPLPDMYGKNLIFKTGGVDATHCEELVKYISEGKISTDILISKKMAFEDILKAYKMFEEKTDNCLKIAITY